MSGAGLHGTDVVVVGLGAATAIGQSAAATAAAARAGISGFMDHPYMIDARGEPFCVAMAPWLPAEMACERRMAELVGLAAQEAMAAVASVPNVERVGAIVGLPSTRPGLQPDLPVRLGEDLSREVSNGVRVGNVQALSRGHSAGLMAIGAACRDLRAGAATFVLAGGVDSHIDPDTLEWLDALERLHIPTNAWGCMPGEAAGFCLLCTAATAARHALPVLGKVASIATAIEANRINTETVCLGKGLTQAVRRVLGFVPQGERIDATLCDQNGEAYRADEFGFTLARTSEAFADPGDFDAPADCWGDVGAASGPLFLVLAAMAAQKRLRAGSAHATVD